MMTLLRVPLNVKKLLLAFTTLILAHLPLTAEDDPVKEEIEKERQLKEEQKEGPSKVEFHGMIYMMGWVGAKTNFAYIYDNDSFVGFTYNFTPYGKAVIDLKLADILKPENKWADTEMYGQIDVLGQAGIKNFSLTIKLGKFNVKNTYFGEYAMGIGKDFIADKRSNMDMINWQLAFRVNKPRFPFELKVTSDLDFGHRPTDAHNRFSDWNDKGLTVSAEALVTELPINSLLSYSLGIFYNDRFPVNEENGHYSSRNDDYLDTANRTTYLGGSTKLRFNMQPVALALGASVKHFDIKKKGLTSEDDGSGGLITTPFSQHDKGLDFDVGLWLGNYNFMDFRAAFQQIHEEKSVTQNTVGLETNLYMIPHVTIYGGVAIATERELANFGLALPEGRSRYGWDIGIIYKPIVNILLTTGWQKMVRWNDLGYFYIKATFWW